MWTAFVVGLIGLVAAPAEASARPRVSIGLNLGFGVPACYHRPVYYVPRPVYVAPAPVYVAPPPVYVAPPAPVYVAPAPVYVAPAQPTFAPAATPTPAAAANDRFQVLFKELPADSWRVYRSFGDAESARRAADRLAQDGLITRVIAQQ
jgi:hypothetical protein